MPLQPGESIPDVSLPSHSGDPVSLSDFAGKPLVILFFPLAFSSTCTEELCTIGDDLSAYRELDAAVVAISVDSPYALERFRTECGADFPFLSDFNRDASERFGVLRESPLGPGLVGVADRAAFVADPGGTIRYTWHSANPSVLPPFGEIKKALEEVGGSR